MEGGDRGAIFRWWGMGRMEEKMMMMMMEAICKDGMESLTTSPP